MVELGEKRCEAPVENRLDAGTVSASRGVTQKFLQYFPERAQRLVDPVRSPHRCLSPGALATNDFCQGSGNLAMVGWMFVDDSEGRRETDQLYKFSCFLLCQQ
jgi:hypothetical protein